MKKPIPSLLTLLIALALMQLPANSQEANSTLQYPQLNAYVIPGLHTGDLFDGLEIYGKRRKPLSFSLALGYRPGRLVELGMSIGMHYKSSLTIAEATRVNRPNPLTEILEIQGSRNALSGRVLFHYSKWPDMEMYSGLRVGIAQTKRKTSSGHYHYLLNSDEGIPDITAHIDQKERQFSAQFILFGWRYYLNDYMGIGVELAAGKPYFVGVQLGSRLVWN